MLRSFKALDGFAIRATDGRIGTVSDICFDDRTYRDDRPERGGRARRGRRAAG